MDFSALILAGLIIIIFVAVYSLPSFLTFLLYKKLRAKGETHKKIGIAIFSVTTLTMLILAIYSISIGGGFGPENDNAEIQQKIGGTLICTSVYTADIHDWQYDVSYEYQPPNSDTTIKIGSGTYHTREWGKDEQLVQYKKWLVLKTGGWFGHDKLIIGDIQANKWTEYHFSAEDIEKEKLWFDSKIHSLLNYCCSESFIDKIDNGEIRVNYKFRTSKTSPNEYGEKSVIYKIDELTGQPVMTAVK